MERGDLKKRRGMNCRLQMAVVSALMSIGTTKSLAIISTWDGGGANDNLSTANNWSINVAPTSDINNTDLVFAGIVRPTPNLSAVFATNSLTFNNTSTAFTFGGSQLNVGAGGIVNNDADSMSFTNTVNLSLVTSNIINAASGSLLFSNPVAIGTSNVTVDGSFGTSFSSMTGSGILTKQGTGTMTWSPIATELLDLVVNAGTVNLAADGSTDSFNSTASIAINGTSTLSFGENATLDSIPLTRATGATMSIAVGKTVTLQNTASATISGALTLSSAGNIVLATNSTLSTTASLTMNGGASLSILSGSDVTTTLSAVNVGIGSGGSSSITVDGSGSTLSGSGATIGSNSATGTMTLSNGAAAVFTSSIGIANALSIGSVGTLSIQSGSSVSTTNLLMANGSAATVATVNISGVSSSLTLTGSATAQIGATSLSSGTVNVTSSGTFSSGTGTVFINPTGIINVNGGTFNINDKITIEGKLNRDATGVLNVASGRTMTIQNGGDLLITGSFISGTSFPATITGAGSTFVAGGSIAVPPGGTWSVLSGGSLSSTGNDILVNGATVSTLLADGSGSSVSAFNDLSIGTSGTGIATFSNTSQGTAGTISIASSGVLGSNGTLNIQSGSTVNCNMLQVAAQSASVTGVVTVTGSGSTLLVNSTGSASIGAASGGHGTLNVSSSATFTSGTGGTAINNTGTMNLTSSGTFSALSNVTVEGILNRDATSILSLAANKTMTVQNGGAVNITGSYALSTNGVLNVTGAGSSFNTTSGTSVGLGSSVNVTSGGLFNTGAGVLTVGTGAGTGTMTVTGIDSNLTTSGLTIGITGFTGTVNFGSEATGTVTGIINVDNSATNGTSGTLNVNSASSLSSAILNLATGPGTNVGVVNVSGFSSLLSITNTATIGAASSSSGTLNVSGLSSFSAINTILNPTGTINITSGTVALGNLTDSGGVINFNSGYLSFTHDLDIQPGGLLGSNLLLDESRTLAVNGITTIQLFNTLTLNGGTLSTASLIKNGTFNFIKGNLNITGASGLTIGTGGALGSTVNVATGQNITVNNLTTVASSGLLMVGDGNLTTAGGLTNNGEVRLGGLVSRITGGTFTNNKLLRGDGRIDNNFNNAVAAAEVRAESGKTLLFTGTNSTNQGKLNLQGGTLQFSLALTNAAAGLITGHGTLINDVSITNNGQIQLSGGNSDIYATLSNTTGSKTTIAGGNNATFYKPVTMNSGSQFTIGTGSIATFFGNVAGTNNISGAGTAEFFGGSSFTLMSYPGTAIVQESATLSSGAIRINSLDVHGSTTIPLNGSTSGVSDVKSISIDATGSLNLHDNDLIVDFGTGASPYTAIRNHVKNGLTILGGAGTSGIQSTEIDNQTIPGTLLGVVDNGAVGGAITSTSGFPCPANSVIVKYTWMGDANLDGQVDGSDYILLDTGFSNAGTLTGWVFGDFDYNGTVDQSDYIIIDTGFSNQQTILPEPTMLGLLGLGAASLIRRRRSM